MAQVTIDEIDDQLKRLSPEKLNKVYQFASMLAEREEDVDSFLTMLASEEVLREEWDTPEEDAAWAHL